MLHRLAKQNWDENCSPVKLPLFSRRIRISYDKYWLVYTKNSIRVYMLTAFAVAKLARTLSANFHGNEWASRNSYNITMSSTVTAIYFTFAVYIYGESEISWSPISFSRPCLWFHQANANLSFVLFAIMLFAQRIWAVVVNFQPYFNQSHSAKYCIQYN